MCLSAAVVVLGIAQVKPAPQTESLIDKVVRLTNVERQRAGVRPLNNNSLLETMAEHQSTDMALLRKMSHMDRQGRDLVQRAELYRYPWMALGENVAQGQRTPEEVVGDWMKSKGHRANILNPDFKEIGVAKTGSYWAQVFGSR